MPEPSARRDDDIRAQPEPDRGAAPLGRVVVLIPTYNERDNVPGVIERVRAALPEVDVCVLDDASPDGTGDVVDALAALDPQVHVRHRAGKQGLGVAYLDGFDWAQQLGYDVVVEMDADGSHRPEDLPRVLAALEHADVAIGSRWVPGGQVVNWPAHRKALSLGANLYTRVLLGMPIKDATAGFRAYRMQALRDMGLTDVASQGYCFQVDLSWRAVRAGLRVVEVPITFVERENGSSKMSRDIIVESLRNITWWGLDHRSAAARRALRRGVDGAAARVRGGRR